MSPELKLYYDGLKTTDIALMFKVSEPAIRGRLQRERAALKIAPRPRLHVINEDVSEFVNDKSLVLSLIKEGVTSSEISKKWDINKSTVTVYLRKWGVLIDNDERSMESYTLSDLYTGWADIIRAMAEGDSDAILTINRKPMIKLVRIL